MADSIPDSERRTRYAPVSATPEFNVGFTLFDDDDVAVFHDGVEIDPADPTDGWSVTASYSNGRSTNAKIVTDGDGWSGVTVDIVGRRRPRRAEAFTDGQGVPARDLNLIVDKLVAANRELYDLVRRMLVLPYGETAGLLPGLAARAGMVLAFDADGDPVASDLVGETGDNGWSPEFAIVSDGTRRVLQLTGYVGGEGTEPTDNVGKYVGATQMETLIANGVDIRGATGASGAGTGDLLAAQNLSDLDDIPTARTNLGLGGLAVLSIGDLGALAVLSEVAYATLAAAAIANEAQALAGTASKLVPASIMPALLTKVPVLNTQTDSYTLALSDAGGIVELNKATAVTLTVPPNASVAFATNTVIRIVQYGAGQVTIAAGSGVTIRSASSYLKLRTQYSDALLYKRGTNEWVLTGDLVP